MRPLLIVAVVASALPVGAAVPAGTTQRVLMKGIDYEPKQVTVHVGDALEWANQDIVAHTATARDRSWDVTVAPGGSGRTVMKNPGRYDYICRFHPNMKAEVVVEP